MWFGELLRKPLFANKNKNFYLLLQKQFEKTFLNKLLELFLISNYFIFVNFFVALLNRNSCLFITYLCLFKTAVNF